MARLKSLPRGFPGGPMVKNPPSNAGDTGSIPGQGTKIPLAVGQLSLCAAAREPMPQLLSLCSLESECHKESPCVSQRRPNTAKKAQKTQ